jgi:hypothetical protein
MVQLSDLEKALLDSWCAETSSEPDWAAANPAWGQCAVTSCIIQDYLGGEVVWAEAVLPGGAKKSHYFNQIDGQELDLTRRQFPEETLIPKGAEKKKQFDTTRDYVLSYPATVERYGILKSKVESYLGI